MSKLIVNIKDWVNCQIIGLTNDDRNLLYDKFKVFIPSARYTPAFKIGRWNGSIYYFQLTGVTYTNLLPEIFDLIDLSKYEIEYNYSSSISKDVDLIDSIDEHYWGDKVWYKGHRLEGQQMLLEEHQVRMINYCLNNHRCIYSSCTSSGKTIMSAVLLNEINKFGNSLIIVPSKDLCTQSADEYRRLGLDVGVVGCGLREFGHKITVCTWQTINSIEKRKDDDTLSYEELNKLKEGLIGLIFDEVHCAKGHIVRKVMESTFKDVPIRWGLTGTINKDKAEKMCLITGIGPIADEKVGSKELQDKGFLSSCNVNCIRLKDSAKFFEYTDEVEYLATNEERLTFISSLIANIVKNNNNTLVLIGRIKTGEILEEKLLKLGCDAIFLNGSTKSKKRFEEYESIKDNDNRCLICTDKIASTGLNIPRLYNLVFLDFGKSFIKSIQSIGRGLRKAKDKDHVEIFDISSTIKFSNRHYRERCKFYEDAEFPYKTLEINNWK